MGSAGFVNVGEFLLEVLETGAGDGRNGRKDLMGVEDVFDLLLEVRLGAVPMVRVDG